MNKRDQHISEDEARELWQRALELQSVAERMKPEPQPLIGGEAGGLSLEQVAAAAEGAGIDPEYVRFTLAERRLADGDRIDPRLWSSRWLRRIVPESDALEESRLIAAEPQRVLAALENVVLRPEFALIREEMLGTDPLRDGVLVYRLANKQESSFHRDLDWADARVLLFTLRPEADATRLRLRVPLFRRGVNLSLTGGTVALGGWGGFAGGSALAGTLVGALGAASTLLLLPVAGGAAGALLGVRAYRGLYRMLLRSGRNSVRRLLQAIEVASVGAAGVRAGDAERRVRAQPPDPLIG